MHRMSYDEFRVALTLRLHLPQKCILSGTVCDCKTTGTPIPLDVHGIHLTTGCHKRGNATRNHDRVKEQTVKLLAYCGLSMKVEERDAFRVFDEENGQRPDITIFNLPDHQGNYYLDVRITSPIPPNTGQLSLTQARQHFRAGNQSFREKMRAYRLATDNNLGFSPIVFETTGQMHSDTATFFANCLNHASRVRKVPSPILWKYWMSSVMCTLQRSMAMGIITRSFEVYGCRFQESSDTLPAAIRGFPSIRAA